jgi:taspase (threonine aspartase 1)
MLKEGKSSEEVAVACTKFLENDELTNAGFGSNCTMDGVVEGDAILIDRFGRCGAVAALTRMSHTQP